MRTRTLQYRSMAEAAIRAGCEFFDLKGVTLSYQTKGSSIDGSVTISAESADLIEAAIRQMKSDSILKNLNFE